MERVKLSFGPGKKRGYDVLVGSGLLDKAASLVRPFKAKRAFIIADARMADVAKSLGRSLVKAGWETSGVSLKAQESAKDFRKMFEIFTQLIESGVDRHSVIFAVGGGVIGDLAGFVAGTYLRGIRWVGVPTTMLAQVDSSLGGKTGVNHPLGKNLIGVFHQPSLVLCDVSLLSSLSKRDVVSGLGEILKYGLAFDKKFFDFLDANLNELMVLSPKVLQKAISESAKWKAYVVGKDEFETLGLRKLLNFGHTLGHALESATEYKAFRHGEAILWGMRWASALSVERGHLSESQFARIDGVLRRLPVPAIPSHVTVDKLMSYTKRDKKAKDGKVDFVLLDRIGHTVIDNKIDRKVVAAALARVGGES